MLIIPVIAGFFFNYVIFDVHMEVLACFYQQYIVIIFIKVKVLYRSFKQSNKKNQAKDFSFCFI